MILGQIFQLLLSVILGGLVHSKASTALSCQVKDELESIKKMSLSSCEDTKKSAECQGLYEEMKATGHNVENFALNCQLDQDLSSNELQSFQIGGCAMGGLKTIINIFSLPAVAGRALGETTAKAVLSLEADSDRQTQCDQNPEQKLGLYQVYNSSVPNLLRLTLPSKASLERRSCAQVEFDFYQAKNQKTRIVSRQQDYKLYQKNPTLTTDEKEYLDWKQSSPEFAERDDSSITRMVDDALRSYDVKIQCYNIFRRMALRCETYSNLVLLGGWA